MACLSIQAAPRFIASDISAEGADLMVVDLDGDGLKDLVFMDNTNLSIFYQDRAQGFSRTPQQNYHLANRPCIVWPDRLGAQAESLLVMTSDGVSELAFPNRAAPPVLRPIVKQNTILPSSSEGENAAQLCLSAETGGQWPLLLVPAADGIHVWQHRQGWEEAQIIGNSIDANDSPSLANPGYMKSIELELSVNDVNRDGRDDLMVSRRKAGLVREYTLYLQQTNGLFTTKPALTYEDKSEPYSWRCWTDLNRDGRPDLIKSTWLNEASFLPGVPSGKVLVNIFMADKSGALPTQPQQVFRKNDFHSMVPFVDVDGDGFPDMVLAFNHVNSKDDITKAVTAKRIDFTLKFYFFQPGAGFPREPDCQQDVILHLDRLEMLKSWEEDFERFARLEGDFNGDGKTDLLVREHDDEVSAYSFVSREKGFTPQPGQRFVCPDQIDGWEVEDLNRDGVSDLIVKLAKENAYRVFISQK